MMPLPLLFSFWSGILFIFSAPFPDCGKLICLTSVEKETSVINHDQKLDEFVSVKSVEPVL